MDPRISFSNDFADTQQAVKQENNYREAPVSSDFEFTVRNFNLIPADEIFFKGMMVPLKENSNTQIRKMTTLREELLVDDEYEDALPRITKNSGWWKERLGLKKTHMLSRKDNGSHVVLRDIAEEKSSVFAHEDEPVAKTIQVRIKFVFWCKNWYLVHAYKQSVVIETDDVNMFIVFQGYLLKCGEAGIWF